MIPEDTRNELLRCLDEARRTVPDINGVSIRYRLQYAYISMHYPDGTIRPLVRLEWQGDVDRWGFALWADTAERYRHPRLQTGVSSGSPEEALQLALQLRSGAMSVTQQAIAEVAESGSPSRKMRWWEPDFKAMPSDFCVYRHDPYFRRAEPWANRHRVYYIGAVYVIAVLSAKILVVMAAGGHLMSTMLPDDLRVDISIFPPFRLVDAVLGGHEGGASSAAIPYLRDYSDIGVSIFLALNLAVLHKQWFQISSFTNTLWNRGALRRNREFYGRFQSKCESQFNSRAAYFGCVLGAVAITAGLILVFTQQGMYFALNVDHSRAWEIAAGESWWANPSVNAVAFTLEATWLLVMCYYVLRQNVVGVLAILRVRELLCEKKEPVLLITPYNVAGVVSIMRTVLIYVYASIMFTTASLVLLYFILPQGPSRGLLLPFLLMCLLCNPLYIVVPWRLFNRELALSIESDRRRIKQNRRLALTTGDTLAATKANVDLEDLELIPEQVFPTQWIWALIGTLIPASVWYASLLLGAVG